MFALIRDRQRFNENAPNCAVYACTVGLRPSHARYYLNEMQVCYIGSFAAIYRVLLRISRALLRFAVGNTMVFIAHCMPATTSMQCKRVCVCLRCNTLQHTHTHCTTLQHTPLACQLLPQQIAGVIYAALLRIYNRALLRIYNRALLRIYNRALLRIYRALLRMKTRWYVLPFACPVLPRRNACVYVYVCAATHCTATQCNTLQHTATHACQLPTTSSTKSRFIHVCLRCNTL